MKWGVRLNKKKQREEPSKFFFDIGKLSFAGVALSASLVKTLGPWIVVGGILLTAIILGLVLLTDSKGSEGCLYIGFSCQNL